MDPEKKSDYHLMFVPIMKNGSHYKGPLRIKITKDMTPDDTKKKLSNLGIIGFKDLTSHERIEMGEFAKLQGWGPEIRK